MKIKENNEKVSLKILPCIFGLSALAAVVIRCLQMFAHIDHQTGFTTGSQALNLVFFLIIVVAAAGISLVSYLSKESSDIEIAGNKSIPCAVSCILFAVSLIYDWGYSFLQSGETSVNATGNLLKDLMISGSLPLLMQSAFAFFTAIFMIILAKDFIKGTAKASKRKIFCLMPLGWVAFRLIHCFIRQISFVKVSDLLAELIMLSFMILFFLAFAQVNASVYSDGFRWRIPAFGYSAALIAFAISIARLVYSLVNGAGSLNVEHPFNITDLMFAVFAVTLIGTLTSKKSNKNNDSTLNV